jgi:hypothetical protein
VFISLRLIRGTCLFLSVIGSLLTLYGCSRVNTDWHRYKGRSFEIIGMDRDLVQVQTDGWRIISTLDDQHKNEYEWGWELSIKTEDIPNEKKITVYEGEEWELLLAIKEIQYILIDEDGFELVKDTVRDLSIAYGEQKTFRHTSTIPKNKALRAVKSTYKVILM